MEYSLIKKQIEVPVIRRITMRIVAIVAAIFDIFFLVLLGLDRLPLLFWAGPAALFLVDAAFIIESFFANYRVRYARLTFRLVGTLGVVAFTFTGLMLYMGSSTMVTYWSMGVFLLERLVVGLFSFYCYKAARKPGKGSVLSVFPALAMTAAAAAVGALTKSALDSYASYEQLVGGVDTLFPSIRFYALLDEYAAEKHWVPPVTELEVFPHLRTLGTHLEEIRRVVVRALDSPRELPCLLTLPDLPDFLEKFFQQDRSGATKLAAEIAGTIADEINCRLYKLSY